MGRSSRVLRRDAHKNQEAPRGGDHVLRHLLGVAFAVALAAAIFFGGGWGVAQMTRLAGQDTSLTSISGLSALGVLLLAGLFLGILMVAPVSPLSTALPGVVMLIWTGLLALNAQLAARIIPLRSEGYGTGFHTMLVSGALVLLGTLMICPVFVPSRWRHEGGDDAGSGDGEDEIPGRPAQTRLLS
jgi:hypothetical protein